MKKLNKKIILLVITFTIIIIIAIFLCNDILFNKNKKYDDWVDYLKDKEFVKASVGLRYEFSECNKNDFFNLIALLKNNNYCQEHDFIRKNGDPIGSGHNTLTYHYISENNEKYIAFYTTKKTEIYISTDDQKLQNILNSQVKDSNSNDNVNNDYYWWWIVCDAESINEQITKIIQENNNDLENTLKLDKNKEWIYDASYNLKTNKESYYGYSDHTKLISADKLVVPYINIDSEDAKKVNQEIYKLYEELINTFNENLKDEIWFTLVEYKVYETNDFISVLISTESAGTDVPKYKYYTYNFNLKNGKLILYNEAYTIAGLNENDINNKANEAITNKLKKEYSNINDFDIYNNKSINNYTTSVNNNAIKFFLDENKNLNIIVTLELPTSNSPIDKIITIE